MTRPSRKVKRARRAVSSLCRLCSPCWAASGSPKQTGYGRPAAGARAGGRDEAVPYGTGVGGQGLGLGDGKGSGLLMPKVGSVLRGPQIGGGMTVYGAQPE
jgi:hypothetical protein